MIRKNNRSNHINQLTRKNKYFRYIPQDNQIQNIENHKIYLLGSQFMKIKTPFFINEARRKATPTPHPVMWSSAKTKREA